jgi:hypothetical protein
MLKQMLRVLATLLAASIVFPALAARADNGTGDVFQKSVVPNANLMIEATMDRLARKRALQRRQAQAPATVPAGSVAQAPPVGQQPVGTQVGLPTGLAYTADISAAYPFGNIGTYGKGWLMGGIDGSLTYGFTPTFRAQASYFQIQHWPYGFNSGLAPVYLAGFRNPVGCADLSGGNGCGAGNGRILNVRTKDDFGVFMLSKLVLLGGFLPLVISPTYVARGGYIGESHSYSDQVPFAYNPPDGPVFQNLPLRTAQFKAVALTLPLIKSPAMFATFTLAPQWLVHTNGVNTTNAMQLPQILYLQYTPNKTTTLWIEPQSARDYLPTDPYPEHLIAYFAGVSQRLTKYSFVQFVLNSGGPTNDGPDNVTAIKCLTVQQILTSSCGVAFGGLKATQLQLQFGIGSPTFFPL